MRVCDPHDAGRYCHEKFGAFELELITNIPPGGEQRHHFSRHGRRRWVGDRTEFQLEDNAKAADPQRCGWLYALYQPAVGSTHDKPADATRRRASGIMASAP